MEINTNESKFLLVYFSGTGGVRRIADAFHDQLGKRNISVIKHSLDVQELNKVKKNYQHIINNIGVIILLYPVHAFDAPVPVFEWIEMLPDVPSLPVAVISVSGGGEVFLNRASRIRCIKALENKGFHVFYEYMMVMPCNWWIPTPDLLALRLIRCIPEKTTRILDKIITGESRRTRPGLLMRITASLISKLEKNGTKKFGLGLKVTNACNGCMWCVRNCPRENIYISGGKPLFGEKCIMCFRCIYGCPGKAIDVTKGRFMVIKQGFNLDTLEKRLSGVHLSSVEEYGKSALWNGVVNYLSKEK